MWGGRQAEFRDPQVAPKHLATAVSTAKRSQNEGEKGRQRGEAEAEDMYIDSTSVATGTRTHSLQQLPGSRAIARPLLGRLRSNTT